MRQLKITQSITNRRESESLEKYFQEINKIDLLLPDEEISLVKRIKEGDQRALEKLIKANLRFVVSVAKQYQNQSLSLNDLINEGNIGLVKAAHKFDETRGFKFISYAVWWIRQSVMQALSENSRIVKIPVSLSGTISKIKKVSSGLEQKYEREPTDDELADALEMTTKEINGALNSASRQVSFDAPIGGDDDSSSLLDVIENENAPKVDANLSDIESLKVEIERTLNSLSYREQEVIKMTFGIGGKEQMTLQEIGEYLGLTRERVRQIKEKGIRKLRYTSRSKLLAQFLE
ncbi:sigma-70 family RNA polymerase sigma factor [Chondrinema litorale]|uniref:sigma-70 family RNA polymerase sigma factor n=1 Tax=Chondrinema litorale TaxID=2994555 RepID=UPI002543AE85|nr:RNA polymerase sigma factor RpoD/SigA [Chondrinema litorale]UZR95376.1 RNA polymerase sigma factor RpoD/SigA [Chondrinema litorale]